MCVNYVPIQRKILRDVFGVEPPPQPWQQEIWPDYLAPIIRGDNSGEPHAAIASFGMIPRNRTAPGCKPLDTTNARSETIGERRTYSAAWKNGQRCLVPMHAFFEPNYEHGPKSVRYRIWLEDEPAFAVAGLWRDWPDGLISFTMLTVNADNDPVMSRMHAPGKEKRSIVVVPRQEWAEWLGSRDVEMARTVLMRRVMTGLVAEADPVVRKAG